MNLLLWNLAFKKVLAIYGKLTSESFMVVGSKDLTGLALVEILIAAS